MNTPIRLFQTFNYQVLTPGDQARVAHLTHLSADKALQVSLTDPAIAGARMRLADQMAAAEANRPYSVVELGVAGSHNPFHLAMVLEAHLWLEQIISRSRDVFKTGESDPLSRMVRTANGNVWLAVTAQHLSLAEASKLVTARTLELIEQNVPLVAPVSVNRPVDDEDVDEPTDWVVYYLTPTEDHDLEDGTELLATEPFYVGRTRDPEKRLVSHIKESRLTTPRTDVARVIRALRAVGIGVQIMVLHANLTETEARAQEVSTIQGLKADGADLLNSKLAGDRPLVLGAEGSAERVEGSRRYSREYRLGYRATAEGKARHRAGSALADLRNGGNLTPRRTHWLVLATELTGTDYTSQATEILLDRYDLNCEDAETE